MENLIAENLRLNFFCGVSRENSWLWIWKSKLNRSIEDIRGIFYQRKSLSILPFSLLTRKLSSTAVFNLIKYKIFWCHLLKYYLTSPEDNYYFNYESLEMIPFVSIINKWFIQASFSATKCVIILNKKFYRIFEQTLHQYLICLKTLVLLIFFN